MRSGNTAFYLREIGIYAKTDGNEPQLYAYGYSGDTADFIPAAGGATNVIQDLNLFTVIGNAQNVSAVITAEIGIGREEFEKYKKAAQEVIDKKSEPGHTHGQSEIITDTAKSIYLNNFLEIDNKSTCTDVEGYSFEYSDYTEAGGDVSTGVMAVSSEAALPKSSTNPVFFVSMATVSGDNSEVYNVKALLYSDGTIYEKSAVLWTNYQGVISNPQYNSWHNGTLSYANKNLFM